VDPTALRRRLAWFSLAAAFLAFDLWTKHVVFYPHVLDERTWYPGKAVGRVCEGWDTILVYNLGVTFGAFDEVPWQVKALVTLAVIVWLGSRLWTCRPGRIAEPLALSMIVGGAVGNLYDRSLRPFVEPDKNPGVRDFLDWYAPPGTALARWLEEHGIRTHWYTSNVADVCIVAGVLLLALVMLREPDEESPTQAPNTEAA
jgi:signal peptidase II